MGHRIRGYVLLALSIWVVVWAYNKPDRVEQAGPSTPASPAPAVTAGPSTPAPPAPPVPAGDDRANAHGIDVSSNNGQLDWDALAQTNQFVYIKATEAKTWVDPLFEQNWQSAKAHGLARGAYHFFRPKEAIDAQVKNFVDTVGPLEPGDLPPMLDLEFLDDKHRHEWLDLPMEERARRVLEWLEKIECSMGVTPVIYISPDFAQNVVGTQNFPEFSHYPLVVADWRGRAAPAVPAPWSDWHFWQYDVVSIDRAIVQSERIDVDRVNGGAAGLEALKYSGTKVACRS